MVKIVRVDALDGGETLDIQLESGHTILLDIRLLLGDARFASLNHENSILNPSTDGFKVSWPSGPSLTIHEIIDIVKKT